LSGFNTAYVRLAGLLVGVIHLAFERLAQRLGRWQSAA